MQKFLFVLLLNLAVFCTTGRAAETLGLSGEWRFALDRADAGTNENWFAKNLPDKIQLPGILEAQNYGDAISTTTPWVLSLYDHFWFLRADYAADTNAGNVKVPFLCQPPRHYLGVAWYQRDFEIPKNWDGQRVVLFLERPHWKSTVWLDEKEIGSDLSLCTPHEFDFGIVPPGKHRLTVRVDNRMILPYRPDAHSISDSLDQAWNGIVGKMELRATTPVWIDELQIYPRVATKSVTIKGRIGNLTGKAGNDKLGMMITPFRFDAKARMMASTNFVIAWSTNGGTFEVELALRADAGLWDEFDPTIYRLAVWLGNNTPNGRHFGLRDFRADGNQFVLNGQPMYIRGTHFGGDFPRTGYPPTDVDSWIKIFQTCKEWGLNSMRFHSWCPPEAAFEAADELGFYLYVEPGMWNTFNPSAPMEAMLYSETERIIKTYGNHPSFVMLSASNEPKGHWPDVLPKWADHFRAADPRRLYTTATGFTDANAPGPLDAVDFTTTGRVGSQRVRGETGWFGHDYSRALENVKVPVIAHELGQWCAYPDYDVIKKFTGFMQPGNFEIFRDSAAANGVLEQNKNFAFASGRFQLACYKEEIEANLRTPGLAGFQLLDLHDYTGQGTALVGLLDPFWESKGYCAPDEFKKFCNQVVPLARLTKRVFTTADKFEVPVEVANFGMSALTNAQASWEIRNEDGETVARDSFPAVTIPVGKNFALGKISMDLTRLAAPASYQLVVRIRPYVNATSGKEIPVFEFINDWNFWLYPAQISEALPTNVFVTSSWDDAEKKLSAGGKVLFLPRKTDLDWSSPTLENVPVFWNRLMSPGWSRMLGLWCDTNHPALAGFPTDVNCDWQWTQIVNRARTMNLAKLPRGLQPIVSAIDDWNRNWKLGVVFEAKVSAGKLMVCTLDLKTDLDTRPVARQLRKSLLDYMASEKFQPKTEVAAGDFRASLFDTLVMKKLGATVSGNGANLDAIIDGDPNTFWQSGGGGRGKNADTRKHPHELVFTFTNVVAMDGVVVMPRQNDRDHLGDVRGFSLATSGDGTNWTTAAAGELASSWSPQTIRFAKTIAARQLKFIAQSGFGNDTSAALAELAVIYAGPKLPENAGDSGQFKRVRSTSSDVDEGGGR